MTKEEEKRNDTTHKIDIPFHSMPYRIVSCVITGDSFVHTCIQQQQTSHRHRNILTVVLIHMRAATLAPMATAPAVPPRTAEAADLFMISLNDGVGLVVLVASVELFVDDMVVDGNSIVLACLVCNENWLGLA